MTRNQRVKQADIVRAVKGATAAGLHVSRVEIDAEGKIVLVSGSPDQKDPDPAQSAYDAWRAKRDARTS
ncbi:hypothetical protein DC522_13020 [Microvirga sp. KLBC 81]|uniref:hypothetical protein n=1 Tax=Microvirga sp. KLBC 81 TaxID=1862707 RepID=UPI000D51DD77|nr:hypothetical protein [Microvirga sp. KLBC 81]PVE24019.1 hypothetical protein DC522_13020 [Microvirga sp. KLBC 81]